MTLIIINKKDSGAIKQALNIDADILLMQDGVYFLNSADATELGEKKVYALKMDVEKRGLVDRLVKDVNLVDYDGMIDLLFTSGKVINL